MEITQVIEYLKKYDGRQLKLMEVCGTHTAAIFKNGIRDLISPMIKLISGPGCPVCVTPTAFIDKCVAYAKASNCELLTFGDMMKVPGTAGSLSENKAAGEDGAKANITIMYSPLEAIEKAAAHPDVTYVVAAVGFETTAPTYALLVKEAARRGIANIRLVTALDRFSDINSWAVQKATRNKTP